MSAVKEVIILGTGGNAIDIIDTMHEINRNSDHVLYECIGLLDDDEEKWGKKYLGVKVLGPLSKAKSFKNSFFINGIGNDKNFWKKEKIIAQTKLSPNRFITLIHPTASVSRSATLGRGSMILQNVTIASNVKIGNHVMVMPNSVISHDVKIGDYTTITGGVCISGKVTVGKSVYFGTNSSIIGYISIGPYSLIGMGSVVLTTVLANSVMIGNPAKFLRKVLSSEKS